VVESSGVMSREKAEALGEIPGLRLKLAGLGWSDQAMKGAR
jgi:hypothetical protein